MQQLGNDPKPAFEEQCEIVSACLDNGIHLFDTTYYQERVALGGILERLG
jgi:aryl-alcohol dehydrogenase-like predicted oxidoreductase